MSELKIEVGKTYLTEESHREVEIIKEINTTKASDWSGHRSFAAVVTNFTPMNLGGQWAAWYNEFGEGFRAPRIVCSTEEEEILTIEEGRFVDLKPRNYKEWVEFVRGGENPFYDASPAIRLFRDEVWMSGYNCYNTKILRPKGCSIEEWRHFLNG